MPFHITSMDNPFHRPGLVSSTDHRRGLHQFTEESLKKGTGRDNHTHRTLPVPPFHNSPHPGYRSSIPETPDIQVQTPATIRQPDSSPGEFTVSKTRKSCGKNIHRDLKSSDLIDKYHKGITFPDHPSTEFKP